MTDQKYKLVPVEPTEEMFRAIYHRLPTLALNVKEVHEALCAAIAAAPEPVCRWVFVGIGFTTACGHDVKPDNQDYPHDKPYSYCPHCGAKVEVVGDD